MRGLVAFCLLFLFAAGAWAQQPTAGNDKQKKTIVRFDGDSIDGDVVRPEGELVAARPKVALPSLVHAPKSFARQAARDLRSAAGALTRNGSVDGN